MYQLTVWIGERMALRGQKRNQHYVDMDGYHVNYETFKQPARITRRAK